MPATAPESFAPHPFGKYQILERIASGGMAEVFKASMEGLGGFRRLYAIKRIRPELSGNREYVDLLVDEAKVAALLSHANIVQILDLGEVDGSYYVAMEHVHGRDLGSVMARCKEKGITLPVPHAVFVAIELLKGLEYAHQRQIMRGGRPMPLNIVHRDVSPSNVLVSFQGEVKVTDFGIARASVKAMTTVAGVIKGKFDYMSPEQAAGSEVDQRSDLYATGVVLYELLCGRHPFRKPGEVATLEAIRDGRFASPGAVNPDVPYPLEVILQQSLARDPVERFQSATAFKEALDRFFHDSGFIFSHSTLAAFVKGLFPEAAGGPPRPRTAAPVPAPLDEPDDVPVRVDIHPEDSELPELGESDDPTLDSLDLFAVQARAADLGEPSANALSAMRAPVLRSLDALAASDAPAGEWETEAPTRLVQDADRLLALAGLHEEPLPRARETTHPVVEGAGPEEAPPASPPAPAPPRESTAPKSSALATEYARPRARPEPAREARPAERDRDKATPRPRTGVDRNVWTLTGVIGTACLVIGLSLGFVAGATWQRLYAAPAAVVSAPPRVEVVVPPGARVTVDGVEVPSSGGRVSARARAGAATRVEVQLPDGTVVQKTFTLKDNEVRLLSLEPWAP